MGDLIVELAGTPAGEALALALALLSAMAHAIFGAVNKGGSDPYLNRGAINITYCAMAAPFALFILPWPQPQLFIVLIAVYFVHFLYEWLQTVSFVKGDFTVVYPIARGTGPFMTAIGALFIFNERLAPFQWFGLVLLSGSIISLALVNYRNVVRDGGEIKGIREAVLAALLTGIMVAVYTTLDAYGIRLAVDPFIFLAWFFFIGGFGFPIISIHRWRKIDVRPPISELAMRGVFGAIIAFISFGAVMLATRLGKVGEAAAFRETSIIFATGIGVLIFKEKIGLPALLLIALIAVGAILVEVG